MAQPRQVFCTLGVLGWRQTPAGCGCPQKRQELRAAKAEAGKALGAAFRGRQGVAATVERARRHYRNARAFVAYSSTGVDAMEAPQPMQIYHRADLKLACRAAAVDSLTQSKVSLTNRFCGWLGVYAPSALPTKFCFSRPQDGPIYELGYCFKRDVASFAALSTARAERHAFVVGAD
jgi:hypothetical protein